MATKTETIEKNGIITRIKDFIKRYTDKRFSTVAGTLVYFLLMSIAPFILWLTLLFGSGKLDVILENELLSGIAPFLGYLKNAAESAASGVSFLFLATTLYSSTNFFYHLRRSGEIIYESDKVKGGIKLRLISLLLIAATILFVAALATAYVVGARFLERYIGKIGSMTVQFIVMAVLLFAMSLILNLFACPFKARFKNIIGGCLITTGLWVLFMGLFRVYTYFSSPERLYGKIASIIVFLLWCYIMACCFVIGMVHNGLHSPKEESESILK